MRWSFLGGWRRPYCYNEECVIWGTEKERRHFPPRSVEQFFCALKNIGMGPKQSFVVWYSSTSTRCELARVSSRFFFLCEDP